MATANQIKFFQQLTNDRDLGPVENMPALRAQFDALDDRNASQWIERAMSREKRAPSDAPPPIAPPF